MIDLSGYIDWAMKSPRTRIARIEVEGSRLRVWVYDHAVGAGDHVVWDSKVKVLPDEIDLVAYKADKERREYWRLKKKVEGGVG